MLAVRKIPCQLYSRHIKALLFDLLEVDESPFFRCVHSIEDNGDMKIKRRSYIQTLAIVAQGVTLENISVQASFVQNLRYLHYPFTKEHNAQSIHLENRNSEL